MYFERVAQGIIFISRAGGPFSARIAVISAKMLSRVSLTIS